VKTTFLHGILEEAVYMQQLKRFVEDEEECLFLGKIIVWIET